MVCQAPTAPFASARNRLRDIVIGALLNSGLAHLLFLPRPAGAHHARSANDENGTKDGGEALAVL